MTHHRKTAIALVALALIAGASGGCQHPHYRQARVYRDANIRFVHDTLQSREARCGANLRQWDDWCAARGAYHARRLQAMDAYLDAETARRQREWHDRQPMFRQWTQDLLAGDEENARRTYFEMMD
ncbi:MAG: hypothetical protein C4547_12695 [Phycisphaerales bacterium]|nr:MAG: hypothetical protein C4547_12695 [Phycisphaerales bacterium]